MSSRECDDSYGAEGLCSREWLGNGLGLEGRRGPKMGSRPCQLVRQSVAFRTILATELAVAVSSPASLYSRPSRNPVL